MSNQNNSNDMGTPTCDCELVPCSLDELIIGCDHGTPRMTYKPGSNGTKSIVLIASEDRGKQDTLKVEAKDTSQDDCKRPGRCTEIFLYEGNSTLSAPLVQDFIQLEKALVLENSDFMQGMTSDLAKFSRISWDLIFGDISNSEDIQNYTLITKDCNDCVTAKLGVQLYPKITWEVSKFGFKMFATKGILNSSYNKAGIGVVGELRGTYGSKEFKIGTEAIAPANEKEADDAFPGIGGAIVALKDISPEKERSTLGFDIFMGFNDSKMELTEHPSDPSKSGLSYHINVGGNPFFRIDAYFDFLEMALSRIPMGNKIRDSLEEGLQDADRSNFDLSIKAKLGLKAQGTLLSGDLSFSREVGAEMVSSGNLNGEVALKLEVSLEVRAKIYLIEGVFKVSGSLEANIRARIEDKNNQGTFYIETDGAVIKVQGEVQGSVGENEFSLGDTGVIEVECIPERKGENAIYVKKIY